MMKRNGTRIKERGSGSNGHCESKIGTCPKCGRENVLLTDHHVWKRSVWGPNKYTVHLCYRCHKRLEAKVRIMENMLLRLFMICYKILYRDFMEKEDLGEDDIMKICFIGLKEMMKNILSDAFEMKHSWVIKRMEKKNILLEKMQK